MESVLQCLVSPTNSIITLIRLCHMWTEICSIWCFLTGWHSWQSPMQVLTAISVSYHPTEISWSTTTDFKSRDFIFWSSLFHRSVWPSTHKHVPNCLALDWSSPSICSLTLLPYLNVSWINFLLFSWVCLHIVAPERRKNHDPERAAS